jgi:hydroxylamine reductase
MNMFCYQCQEALKNVGCTNAPAGVCGKDRETANLQDVLTYALKGLAVVARKKRDRGAPVASHARRIIDGLFVTVTNTNFDADRIAALAEEAATERQAVAGELGIAPEDLPPAAQFEPAQVRDEALMAEASILSEADEDVRSLKEFIVYGLRGIAAYAHHAFVLGSEDDEISNHVIDAMAATTQSLSQEELVELLVATGNCAVSTMALLDAANTGAYGNPEITSVNIGVRNNPGILISGHDLKDMEELLEQTKGTGVDVYTHCEMLPANYYPAFKKYEHFVGNYGGSWYRQNREFASFNGAILMTTNCITPVQDSYRDRMFTTGTTGYPGIPHIPDREPGGKKDFSAVIQRAKACPPPTEIEQGTIVGGFAHHQVEQLAGQVVEAVKSRAIKKFVVMAGCDGRMSSREYFTELAQGLPADTVILTAGCAKYRYNKLDLGEINGIPRVLDAGQCNDSYSLAVTALKLKEAFQASDVNELPIEFAVAWYEQKAVAVLLALLALGFKGVRIGPTLPAFVSPKVAQIIVSSFGLTQTASVEEDLKAIAAS